MKLSERISFELDAQFAREMMMISADEYEKICKQLMHAEQAGAPVDESAPENAELFQQLRDYEYNMLRATIRCQQPSDFDVAIKSDTSFAEFIRQAGQRRLASKSIVWRLHRLAGLDYVAVEDPVIAEAECDPASPRGAWCALARDLAASDEKFSEQLFDTIAVHGQPSQWDELRYGRMYMLLQAVLVSGPTFGSAERVAPEDDPFTPLYERWRALPHFPPVLAAFLKQQRESGVYTATPAELAEMMTIYHYECESRRRALLGPLPSLSALAGSDADYIMQEAGLGVLEAGPGGTSSLGVPVPTVDEGELAEARYPGLGRFYGFEPEHCADVLDPASRSEQPALRAVVERIIADLRDRRGFSDVWDSIEDDEEVVSELRDTWVSIIGGSLEPLDLIVSEPDPWLLYMARNHGELTSVSVKRAEIAVVMNSPSTDGGAILILTSGKEIVVTEDYNEVMRKVSGS